MKVIALHDLTLSGVLPSVYLHLLGRVPQLTLDMLPCVLARLCRFLCRLLAPLTQGRKVKN